MNGNFYRSIQIGTKLIKRNRLHFLSGSKGNKIKKLIANY